MPMSGLRQALGHVHVQPGLPVQLRLLHQRWRLWAQVECAPAEQFVEETVDLSRRYGLE